MGFGLKLTCCSHLPTPNTGNQVLKSSPGTEKTEYVLTGIDWQVSAFQIANVTQP